MKEIKVKNLTGKYYWTNHVQMKMSQYGVSKTNVLNILRDPQRIEIGVCEDTYAAMKKKDKVKNPYEIWVMYQIRNTETKDPKEVYKLISDQEYDIVFKNNYQVIIISAWKYPGITNIEDEKVLSLALQQVFNNLN